MFYPLCLKSLKFSVYFRAGQFVLTTFQVLISLMWLLPALWDRTDLEKEFSTCAVFSSQL